MTAASTISIPDVELRVYQNFSEVRTLIQSDADQLQLTFPAATWSAIDDTSITLLGLPYTSKTVIARDSWLSSFEGRCLWLRRPTGREEVTLIRAEDRLVPQYPTLSAGVVWSGVQN